ncbi:hypothetical protein SynBIOSE41_03248 [Synechococcus sp. BIOS-E4-1]|nr:hypothetical protein SynBIOSE41_03248 [Synechococcus sp. BIOS-E4-1]
MQLITAVALCSTKRIAPSADCRLSVPQTAVYQRQDKQAG